MKDSEINQGSQTFNGLYMHGKLEGVDFTKSGKNNEGLKWGASVKLNFALPFTKRDVVNGVEIVANTIRYQIISIASTDDLLPIDVDKYSKLIGNHVSLSLQPSQGDTFKLAE